MGAMLVPETETYSFLLKAYCLNGPRKDCYPHLSEEKLSPREMKDFTQGHPGSQWQGMGT